MSLSAASGEAPNRSGVPGSTFLPSGVSPRAADLGHAEEMTAPGSPSGRAVISSGGWGDTADATRSRPVPAVLP